MVNCSLKKLPMLPNDSNFGDVRPDASTDGTGELDGFLATPGARRNSETWPSMMTSDDWDLYSVLNNRCIYSYIYICIYALYIVVQWYIHLIYIYILLYTYVPAAWLYVQIYLGLMYKYIYLIVYVIICLFIYFSLLDMNWNWITYIYIYPETLVFWLFAADFPWRQSTAQCYFTKNLDILAFSGAILKYNKPLSAAGDLAQDSWSPRPVASKSSPKMAVTQTRRPALLPTAATRWTLVV